MRIKRSIAAASITALVAVAVGASTASAAVTDHDVRPADFTVGNQGYATSDTRSAGHLEFLKEGIHLYTDNATSQAKVAEYFTVNKPLAGITQVEYEWFGTTPSPGAQYVMDFDNDGTQDGILVGEKVYGGQDVWLTNGSKEAYKGTGAPSNTGGSGTDNHGTLAEWSAKYPNAKILFGGFSLGSGVLGDGVLRSISYGDDRYLFTDEAPVVVPEEPTTLPVTAFASSNHVNRVARFTMASSEQPANDTGRGTKVEWKVLVNGNQKYISTNGWGDLTTWTWSFAKGIGVQKVALLRNGVVYRTANITTN